MYLPLPNARSSKLRIILAVIVLAFSVAAIAVKTMFSIKSPYGSPVGSSLRAGTHIATLIQTLEPYVVSLHRNPANDRYRVGLFLSPVDGNAPGRLIPIGKGFRASQLGLMRLLDFDGSVVWFDVTGIGGVDVQSGNLASAADVQTFKAGPANRDRGVAQHHFDSKPEFYLAPSAFPSTNEWLGLISPRDAERNFKKGSWVRYGTRADDTKEVRQFYQGLLGPAPQRFTHAILSITPVPGEGFLNAAFVCAGPDADVIRLSGPDGFLMIHTSEPGLKGTLMVARVDTAGQVVWKADTGLDRFLLRQILPDARFMAFAGTRLPIPDKVSEPLLVVIDTQSGAVSSTSLWQ